MAVLGPRLDELADPERAGQMRAYMRDQFDFLGISSADVLATWQQARREVVETVGAPTAEDTLAFAEACWDHDERELQYVGARELQARVRLLRPEHLGRVRALVQSRSWWDTVDILAPRVVGPMAEAHDEVRAAMDEWIEDDDVWVVRSALLHQLFHRDDTDVERLAAYCRRQARHPDFFVRKAIGWALRQYSYTDPAWVTDFVRRTELTQLSAREAMKAIERRRARPPD